MNTIQKLPLLGLAFGAMMTAATAAWAEGDVVNDEQTEMQIDDTQMNTGADVNTDGTLDTDEDGTLATDTDVDSSAEASMALDSSTLKEIEDENVTHDGMTVAEIEGTDVYIGDDDIGEIETVLGDDTGTVKAYILSVEEGLLDWSGTRFVVPADQFTFDAENDRFSTQLTQADIETYETWQ